MQTFPRHTRWHAHARTAPGGLVAAAAAVLTLAVTGCGVTPPDDPAATTGSSSSPASTPAGSRSTSQTSSASATDRPTPADPSETDLGDECEYVRAGTGARPADLPPETGVVKTGTARVTMITTEGRVIITMNRAKAPCTVNSFLSLVRQGFYDQTSCHNLQDLDQHTLTCGDPTGTGDGGPGYTSPDETTGDEVYAAGVVAMINNPQPAGGTSQFLLVFRDSDLPPDATIFGTMDAKGLGVVNRISAEGSDNDGRPNNPAEITSITIS